MRDAAIVYRHSPALGGMRKPRRDSRNTAWRVEGFRGYADYMETEAFRAALDQLVADALVARGIEVRHITSAAAAPEHTLTDFAQVADGFVTYRSLI